MGFSFNTRIFSTHLVSAQTATFSRSTRSVRTIGAEQTMQPSPSDTSIFLRFAAPQDRQKLSPFMIRKPQDSHSIISSPIGSNAPIPICLLEHPFSRRRSLRCERTPRRHAWQQTTSDGQRSPSSRPVQVVYREHMASERLRCIVHPRDTRTSGATPKNRASF